MNTSLFKQLIEDKFGIFIDSARDSILQKAIEQRMELSNIGETNKYYDCIQGEEAELKNLVSLMTVNESYFFREKRQLDLLLNQVIPYLIAQRPPDSKIKILSAGCSTGEEPYSIAIACHEKFGAQISSRLQIFAFDVDKEVIESAKIGIYGKSSFRKTDEHSNSRFFNRIDDKQNQIDLSLRKQVTFFEHNLLNTAFPQFIQNVDVIFYRNVSIYFKPRTQKKVFEKLSTILNPQGFLFMSATETFVHDIGILKLIELSDCFVFKKVESIPINQVVQEQEHSGEATPQFFHKASENEDNPGIRSSQSDHISEKEAEPYQNTNFAKTTDNRGHFNKALELLRFNRHAEALEVIEFIETQYPESKKLNILKARILNELNQKSAAKAICATLIEKDQWYVWPYLYLGLFASHENDSEEMVRQLKRAIYVQPTCWLAHYYLAEYFYSTSSFNSAVREIRNVIRLLEKSRLSLDETELYLEPVDAKNVLTELKKKLSQLKSS